MKKLSLFLIALTMLLVSCKPEVEKPTVVTKSVGEVTKTSAKVVGQVAADGGAEVTERGICWSTDGTPTILDFRVKDTEGGLGSYEILFKDLVPNTQYYVRAYATNEAGTGYGDEKTFTTLGDEPEEPGDEPEEPGDEPEEPGDEPEEPEQPEEVAPVVKTAEVTDIKLFSAVCGGEVVSNGDAVVVARGVCWNTSGTPTVSDTYTMDGTNIGSFVSSMKNLEHNTTYYVRAYATNANGITAYGEEKSFTTLEKLLPTVTTATEVTDITVSSAKCGGEVTFNGNITVTARGVCWSTSQNPTIEDNKTTNGSGVGSYTSNMTNLEHNTTYYVRAYATNEVGTFYGEEVTFTTLEKLLPVVTTTEVTGITCFTAVSGGEVTFDGNVEVTARGICWSTSQNPTIEDNKTTNGSGVGSYTSNMTNLEHNTTYYVRAYATNEVGTFYGEEVTFTTLEKLLPVVTTTEVTGITCFTAVSGGEVTFDGNVEVTARGICWSTTQTPTIEDNKTNNGSGVGTYTYKMTNLELNTKYYVRAYATNEVGTFYGEEVSFTTLAAYSPATGTSNGYGYVDLGLSVKWATCNVGATSPEGYGDYFAWGETTTKEKYYSSNCPTYGLSKSELQSQGYIDSEGNLTPQYDAATANWGGTWRMPTYAELNELNTQCTWEWINTNDFKGYKVTGPNGNSIFLPAAGYRLGSSLHYAGNDGRYWSSTPYGSYDYYAYRLRFYSSLHFLDYYDRGNAQSVRPILE